MFVTGTCLPNGLPGWIGPPQTATGMGCVECGGTCGGMGLFDSGMDVSTWGYGEWACVAGAAYVVVAMLGTARRGVSAVKRKGKAMRRAVRA
jgi:hypothetical protein